MVHKIILALLAILIQCGPISAAQGDTKIYISYRTKSVRVKPSPRIDYASVDLRLILQSDGKVKETSAVEGGAKGTNAGKLGAGSASDGYKVIDASTITRTKSAGNYFHTIMVKVTGKNCVATIARRLKPGETLFSGYSAELRGLAYFSSIENQYTTCVIE